MATPKPGHPVRGSASGRSIMALLDLLGRRWTLRILWEMREGHAMSFREIQTACDDLSPTSLNKRLQELRETLIVRLVENEGYQLTETGSTLLQKLAPLNDWAEEWSVHLED
jgi:DNA-binding HxlR family transcriptional regulator